jgi:hypothetical protein
MSKITKEGMARKRLDPAANEMVEVITRIPRRRHEVRRHCRRGCQVELDEETYEHFEQPMQLLPVEEAKFK